VRHLTGPERDSVGHLYAEPKYVDRIEDCYFYHAMDLPELGKVPGDWDLRAGIHEYLGGVDFAAKRVLDVGAASGALSFFMESKGAEVVSYDLGPRGEWDLVPFAGWADFAATRSGHQVGLDRLANSYWLSHRLRQSKARVVYGNVYEIPEQIGSVDIAVYGSILLHLRDPFLALQRGLALTRETVIVAEVLRGHETPLTGPYLGFLPDADTLEPKDTWWDLRPELIVRMVRVLGFMDTTVSYHTQEYDGRPIELYTVVGRRSVR
jgi:hypothetical protein